MNTLFAEPAPLDQQSLPRGFMFASAACGIKKKGSPDVALISSDRAAVAAAVFTTNRVKAAPVLVSHRHIEESGGVARAIIANSGNANCATGAGGLAAARATAAAVAREVRCPRSQVLVCSTGVIGVPIETDKLTAAIPDLVRAQRGTAEAYAALARAIMTTDTRPKWSAASCRVGGKEARVLGCAKGAGMIHPQMATMLAFVVTDAALTRPLAARLLREAAGRTFNSVTVDGDTSTNDTLILLSNGASGAPPIRSAGPDLDSFSRALESVCHELALAIVSDGEGASRVAEIEVRGVASDRVAGAIARTIAGSPLVKTAIAGADPNWGRILAAAGRALLPNGARFNPERAEIRLGGITVCRRGQAHPFDESAAHQKMLERHLPILVDFKTGPGRATVWTCDFTEEYVRINASYRS
ncbi:MAG TPA: bifunctional glutamate N-acetyltransferase/amino-acid acetyltransferase ArgJ [Terriglobia bacterium]|jgi:glutamate N-acetyltransferase/amino-acid N-acetyltransferase|nr:bifunctional glutamate N-acetyltransferase/amino-acid acetyltransferase ArgJ [Terriglobia bacterium]